jgi:protein O-mannosyl-transferase
VKQSLKPGPAWWNQGWLFGGLLLAATVLAYWPALHGGFVWDDDSWTTKIAHLLRNGPGLYSIWFEPTALQQYYPLTGTTFWSDYHLWKFWTFPYHVENVILHLTAVFLFWRLLWKLEVPGAWLAAAIFALHPMMVESVAWITERKNVLSMVFFLGGLLAYGRFNSFWKPSNQPPRRWVAYGLAFLFLLAALLAKTTTFSFPAVILLITWWKRGRIQWRGDVLPLLPFFAAAIGFSGLTAWLEKNHVGAAGWEWNLSLPERCLIVGRAFWFYPEKLLWPADLCFIYPRWKPEVGSWWQWLPLITALGALVALWGGRQKLGRGPATAAFFFVGTIFPLLGFINAYGMRYSWVWDHWVYLPSLGVIALGAASMAGLARHFNRSGMLFGAAVVLLPLLAFLTWKQSAMFSDNETLWQTTIVRNPNAFIAYNNLGYILMERNQLKEAIPYFEKSLAIDPKFDEPHNNLGQALIRTGRTEEGMSHFQKASESITSDPATAAVSHYNYGNAWLETGHPEEAMAQYQKALAIRPDFAEAQNNMGYVCLRLGQTNEACVWFQKAIATDPDLADAHNSLGKIFMLRGQNSNAMENFKVALKSRPDFREALDNLTGLLMEQGKTDEAIQWHKQAIRSLESADLYNNLGNLLASQKRLAEAIEHFNRAVQLCPTNGEFHYNLAVILALQNRLDEAVAHFRRSNELMPGSAPSHYRLGLALQSQKQIAAAMAEYEKALALNPKHGPALNNLAWLLATCPEPSLRDGGKAVALSRQADQLSGGNEPGVLDTLAAAYAEAGRFPEAVETARRALKLPATQNNPPLAKAIQTRLKLYEADTPYHEPP